MRCVSCGNRAKSSYCSGCRRAGRANGSFGSSGRPFAPPPPRPTVNTDPATAFSDIPLAADPYEMTLQALVALEDALKAQAEANGVSAEMASMFARYSKLKQRALRPLTELDHEARLALKMTLVEAVKMVF